MLLPVPAVPEAEALGLLTVVTHRGVSVRSSLEVEVDKLLKVGANDLRVSSVRRPETRNGEELTRSESMKMTRSSSRGKRTSRKRILYLRSGGNESQRGLKRDICENCEPPNRALFLLLGSKPMRPLVRDELVVKVVL